VPVGQPEDAVEWGVLGGGAVGRAVGPTRFGQELVERVDLVEMGMGTDQFYHVFDS